MSLYSKEGIYSDFTYGAPGVSRGMVFAFHVAQNQAKVFDEPGKVLVLGAGNGYEIVVFRLFGWNVAGLEFYVPNIEAVKEVSVIGDASDMPFGDKEFDLVFCCEMLEHIEDDVCMKILQETNRVGKNFFFSIATRDDPPYDTHINLKRPGQWVTDFENIGFDIKNAQFAPRITIVSGNYMCVLRYSDGVMVYGSCSN
jgi:SAM-dependent methyltransferase